MSTTWRLTRKFIEALLAGLLAGTILLVLAPVAIGWRPYTVLTGSMRPGIQPGDVVMDRPIPVPDMHVGDVVTFTDSSRGNKLVTHRVRSIAHGTDITTVETRGDANNTSEHWTVQTKDRIGRVVFVIPKVGKFANAVRNPAGILLLIVVPILALGFLTLRSIWRDDEDDDPTPDDHTGPDEQDDTDASADYTAAPRAPNTHAPTPQAPGDQPQPGDAATKDSAQAATLDAPAGGDR